MARIVVAPLIASPRSTKIVPDRARGGAEDRPAREVRAAHHPAAERARSRIAMSIVLRWLATTRRPRSGGRRSCPRRSTVTPKRWRSASLQRYSQRSRTPVRVPRARERHARDEGREHRGGDGGEALGAHRAAKEAELTIARER